MRAAIRNFLLPDCQLGAKAPLLPEVRTRPEVKAHSPVLQGFSPQQPTRSALVAVRAVRTSLPRATFTLSVLFVYHSCSLLPHPGIPYWAPLYNS